MDKDEDYGLVYQIESYVRGRRVSVEYHVRDNHICDDPSHTVSGSSLDELAKKIAAKDKEFHLRNQPNEIAFILPTETNAETYVQKGLSSRKFRQLMKKISNYA